MIIPKLHSIIPTRRGNRCVVSAEHWLHRRFRFRLATGIEDAQIYIFIDRRGLRKNFVPIDVPVREKRSRVAWDSEKDRPAVGAGQSSEIQGNASLFLLSPAHQRPVSNAKVGSFAFFPGDRS